MTTQRSALESGDMYSTAFQFYSHIQASVDPRTGMYTASVDLTTGEGNRLRGPSFGFRLAYSPMGAIDDGFGKGWRLAVTELDPRTGMLSLSTGDTHKVENLQAGAEAYFPDRKLKSCKLTMLSTSPLKAMVEHITGIVEYLSVPAYVGNVLRTERIVQANGDSLRLSWNYTPSGLVCLTKVTDDLGVVLLKVDYANPTQPRLDLFTHQETPLSIVFRLVGERIERISIPTLKALNIQALEKIEKLAPAEAESKADDEAEWRFVYRPADGDLVLLESVTLPDGTREEVTYDSHGLLLPHDAPRQYMPAVSQCIRRSLASQGVVQQSSYDYGLFNDHNFYGQPVVGAWSDGKDQLLHLEGQEGYLYGSIETLKEGSKVFSVIERTYDQFHLMTRQKTTRGTVVEQVDTEYGIIDAAFEQQPTTFQLPHKVTTTLSDTRHPGIEQVNFVENRYDDMGNIVYRYDGKTGVVETSEYYPVEGETEGDTLLCPADPMGLVRRLKSRTVDPGDGRTPVRVTSYRYRSLDMLDSPVERTHYIQASAQVISTADGAEPRIIEQSTQEFIDDKGPFHGNVIRDSRTQDGMVETRDYTYAEDESSGTLTTVTRHTTHDGIENTSSEAVHLISGLTARNTDTGGNHTDYTYDLLGRLASEVASPDAEDYRVETRWDYLFLASERWVQRTGVTGLPHRSWFDEQGKRIRQEEPLADGTLRTMEEAVYDAFGQLVSETARDYLDGDRDLALTTLHAYDDWGQDAEVTAPDGSRTLSETALVRDGDEVLSRTTQWRVDGDGAKTGWKATDTDQAGRKRRTQTGTWTDDGDTVTDATYGWRYDGLGRCIEMTAPFDQVTGQSWDEQDRLVTTVLPDGTVIAREYAPGQGEELIARLTATPGDGEAMILGTRHWDGLGRLMQETSGSLTTRHEYQPGQTNATAKTMPGGGRIEMAYDRRLQEVLLSATLMDGRGGRADASLRTASYDKRIGLPSNVSAPGHSMDIQTDYLGRMTRQTVALEGDSPRSSEVEVSPGGREMKKTGVDGVIRTLGYDALGRLASIDDADVSITLSYDALSQLEKRTTLSKTDARTITETRAYDALGRVIRHGWAYSGGEDIYERRLDLGWRADDKVEEKRWSEFRDGAFVEVRKETMEYDSRGRLVVHAIGATSEGECPRDEAGHAYVRQTFEHDCIDNILEVVTTRFDGQQNVTRYTYDPIDRDRLSGLSNSLEGYPGYDEAVELRYDDNGNLVDDGMGRKLEWDAAGRLTAVTLEDGKRIDYGQGPDDRVSRIMRDGQTTFRYREDGAVAFETGKDESRRYIRTRGGMVAETRIAGAIRQTWLLGVDPQGSVITEA